MDRRDAVERDVDAREDRAGLREEEDPRLGEPQPAPPALEELRAELALEGVHGAATELHGETPRPRPVPTAGRGMQTYSSGHTLSGDEADGERRSSRSPGP